MSSPPPTSTRVHDSERLAAVRRTGLLDSGPDPAFDRLAGLAARLLDAPSAFITVVDEHRSYWKACIGSASAQVDGPRENPVDESFCQYVIEDPVPFIVGDTCADPRTRDNASVTALGVAAWAGFPLMSPDGHVLGSFCVTDTVPRGWTDRQIDILRTLTDAAAAEVALIDALAEERMARAETARALAREQRALVRAEALMLAGVALSERIDAASVLRALVGATVPDIGVWCAVHLRRRGASPELVAVGHRDPGRVGEVQRLGEPSDDAPGWLDEHVARPVVLLDRPRSFRIGESDPAACLGACEVVSLPLRVRGQTIGALTVGVDPDEEHDAAGTIAGLAGQAAVALDNAALYDEQAEVARILQQALLPGRLPEIDGAQLAVRFRPAGAHVQVGGDFYDVFATRSRAEQAFVVGDVAGKGPVAATLTSVVRHTLRAAFFRGDDPRQAIALANEALYDVADAERFCTAIYGHMRIGEGHLDIELVRAGHPAALVLRAAGAVEIVEPAGGLIGSRLETTWDVATLSLAPGDALLLYTDGAVEFPGRDVDGDQALQALVGQLAGCSAQEIVEAVEHETIVLSDGPLRDDLALLVIRCLPART